MRLFLLVLLASLFSVSPSFALLSGYQASVTVNFDTAPINSSVWVNLTAVGVSVSTEKGMEIKVTDSNDSIVPYQTVVNGRWYANGISHNVSNAWRNDNFVVVLINGSNIQTSFKIQYNNITEQSDTSQSILVRYDDFQGYSEVPTWVQTLGVGGSICQSNGRTSLCATGGAGQHFVFHVNATNSNAITLNIEFNQTRSGLNNGFYVLGLNNTSPNGYSVQETPADTYLLTKVGGSSCGANASITKNYNNAAMNFTMDRSGTTLNAYLRTSNTALDHISCSDSTETTHVRTEIQGGNTAILGFILYNKTVVVRNNPSLSFVKLNEIQIISPENSTSLNNTAFTQFKILGNATTYKCWKSFDGSETFISATIANDTLINNTLLDLSHGSHRVSFTCENNNQNVSKGVDFTTLHFNITQFQNPQTVFETERHTFNITIQTISNISDITAVLLNYNNTLLTSTRSSKSGFVYGYQNIFDIKLLNTTQTNITQTFFYNVSILYLNSSKTSLLSESRNHTVFKLIVDTCTSGLTNNQTLNFTIRNEEDIPTTIKSDINIAFDLWKGTGLVKRQLGFNTTNSATHAYCIYPINQTYMSDVTAQYKASGYSQRDYFIVNGTLNNKTQFLDIYVLNTTRSFLTDFTARDSNSLPIKDAVIKILRFYPEENVFRIVVMGRTSQEGKASVNIAVNDPFYKIIVEKNAALLLTTQSQKVTASGLVLTVPELLSVTYDVIGRVSSSCVANATSKIISCTYTDTSGFSGTYNLTVTKQGATKTTGVCSETLTSASGTLLCDLTSQANGTYYYRFDALYNPDIPITSGSLTIGLLGRYGDSGIFLGFLMFMVLAFIGIFSPVASMLMGSFALVISSWLGLLPIQTSSMLSLIFLIIIAVWKAKT